MTDCAGQPVLKAALLCGLFSLAGCGAGEPPSVSSPAPPPSPAAPNQSPASRASAPPDLGFIPLPSVEQVQQAAPGGRADPFQPLPAQLAAAAQDGAGVTAENGAEADLVINPASDLTLTGVMLVGSQRRAFVQSPAGSAVLCIGNDGRCSIDAEQVLPATWSVLSIDLQRGCLQLAQAGKPQNALCLS